MKLTLNNKTATQSFARQLAECCRAVNKAIVIYLEGDLGAGKTTFAQGFIQNFGFGRVKSPTYTLVESYQNDNINIHHFDCYRLNNPEELELIGIRDYLTAGHIQLIEWPDLGLGAIAKADISIRLRGDGQIRELSITNHSLMGGQLLCCVQKQKAEGREAEDRIQRTENR